MSNVLEMKNTLKIKNVFEIDHPLVQSHLTKLRDKNTPPSQFRIEVRRLSYFLSYEATKDLKLRHKRVKTPLAMARGCKLKERIGLIPILRAGLEMVSPVLEMIPEAEVWPLGLYRDEKTFQPVEYYKKFPKNDPVDVAFILDPMLATGGTLIAALKALEGWGVPSIKVMSLIAAPEGIQKVCSYCNSIT